MNRIDVVNLINKHPENAKKALEHVYHGKVFVVVASYGRIDNYFKTRRGAEGYIKKQSNVSWYDEYSHQMVSAGAGLDVVEISESDIKDWTTDKKMWHNWFLSWLDRPQWADNIVHSAKRWVVMPELMEWIEETAKVVKETQGLPALKEEIEEVLENIDAESIEVTKEESSESSPQEQVNNDNTNVIVKFNEQMNGIELYFSSKPDQTTIDQLKINGFRWSKRGFWYAKQSESTITFADSLNSLNRYEKPQKADNNDIAHAPQQYTYPNINIDDLDQYTVSDELQRRLHSSSLFEVDYKKDCKLTFQNIQNQALEIISSTDNERIIYYIKKYLQSYKKRYYEQYIKILNHRANNPSWAVTGRGGLNVSRYNKMQNRYDKYIGESVAMSKEFERKMNQFKDEIWREKDRKWREKVNNSLNETEIQDVFTVVTKNVSEHGIQGYNKSLRFYKYKDYSIVKAWGMFRIFKNGKEIKTTLKTTDTLETAKRYVLMLCQQETA